jgi:hypothetical protein
VNWRGGNWYDVMQVCMNGHKITEYAISQPESRQKFCELCGAETIDKCPECNTTIRGFRHIEGVFHTSKKAVPKYCIECGAAYPWQASSIENLKDVLSESGLSQQDIQDIETALPDIVRDTTKTEGASLRIKRILGSLGKDFYSIVIKIVSDIASETAKKTLGI